MPIAANHSQQQLPFFDGKSFSIALHVAAHRRAGPLERVAAQQHVPDEGLDGSLADEPDEEELLYDGGGHCSEGWEAEEEFTEPGGLVGVLAAAVLLQRALRLLLQLLDHRRVCEANGV